MNRAPAIAESSQGTSGRSRSSDGVRFRLLRYFAFTSLVGVLVVLAPLLYFYRDFATEALEQHESHDNVVTTKVFAATFWPRYASHVKNAHLLSKEQLRQSPAVEQFRADVLRQMHGLSVVKVKVYDLHGTTVFSTDMRQVGDDKSDDGGVKNAIAGKTSSEITFRNQFDAFENVINDRNLISTYIPIRTDPTQPIEGVFEVYSDVTEYVEELNRTSWEIVGVVLGSLSFLYLFLFAIVRRADRTLRAREQEVSGAHEAVLTHLALHDPLTGLPNRDSLARQLNALLKGIPVENEKLALLCIGLDGFKAVNDSLGHQVGDAALAEISRRLERLYPDPSALARMGGDEFVVTLTGLDSSVQVERVVQAIERIQAAIARVPISVNGHDLSITASVGAAIFPDDGMDVAELLQASDVALSHAKKEGRARYQFHTSDMNARALNLLLVERDLRRALDEGQFLLHYQPKIDLFTGQITGAEALIRWQHPTRGLVAPGDFILIAEERGLIVPIGDWVMREACRQNAQWQQAGMDVLPIAINLSAMHFQRSTLLRDVQQALQDYGLPADCLELELTESTLTQDGKATIATMEQLKRLGVYLALDDFGTGYSSLSQLKGLPLDNLKLDQSFVRGLPSDKDDMAICTAVIAMGRALGLKVIAEGVETNEQLGILRALGCDVAQGFLFAKPLTADQFLAFVERHGGAQVTAFGQTDLDDLP